LAISTSDFQSNSHNIDYNRGYGSQDLKNKSYRFILEDFEKPLKTAEFAHEVYKEQGVLRGKSKPSLKGESDIQKIPTSIPSPLQVYPLSPEISYELLKEGAVYENIDLIENLPSEDLEEEAEISEELKEFENDMLKDNIILNEEESELFIQELNSLHYDDDTLEFYKSSTHILKKIKNGEFIIDL